jgi:hypothetical protein
MVIELREDRFKKKGRKGTGKSHIDGGKKTLKATNKTTKQRNRET